MLKNKNLLRAVEKLSNTTFIYALTDPRTFEVRYIGKSDNPYERYCKHLLDISKTHKVAWVKLLLSLGLLPILQIVEQCDKSVWQQKERDWIAFEKRCGCNLTNATEGGSGYASYGGKGHKSYKVKRKFSDRTRIKMSLAHTGKGKHKFSDKAKKNISDAAKKRKPMSLERRSLLSNKMKGVNNPFYGKKHSEETKNLISFSRSKRKSSSLSLNDSSIKQTNVI